MPYSTGYRVINILYMLRYLFNSYNDLIPLNAIMLIKKTIVKKKSRTPLIVPRIIEISKDVDPHLDQREVPLAVK